MIVKRSLELTVIIDDNGAAKVYERYGAVEPSVETTEEVVNEWLLLLKMMTEVERTPAMKEAFEQFVTLYYLKK
jgi:hypothetical protein